MFTAPIHRPIPPHTSAMRPTYLFTRLIVSCLCAPAISPQHLPTQRARFDVVGGKVRSLASYYQIGTCSGVECKDDNVQRDALTQFGLFIQLQYSSWYKQQYTLYEHLYDLSFQSSIIYRKQIMSLLRSDYEKFVPKVSRTRSSHAPKQAVCPPFID